MKKTSWIPYSAIVMLQTSLLISSAPACAEDFNWQKGDVELVMIQQNLNEARSFTASAKGKSILITEFYIQAMNKSDYVAGAPLIISTGTEFGRGSEVKCVIKDADIAARVASITQKRDVRVSGTISRLNIGVSGIEIEPCTVQ